MRSTALLLVTALMLGAPRVAAGQAQDPSERLRAVLPADVADRVLATIAQARSQQLPAAALENRALKFAARGVNPADIEQSVREHAERMRSAHQSLASARRQGVEDAEIEAAAEAMRLGVSGESVSELARTSPSGRSLAVPLYVIGSLVERGLPSDEALRRVHERMLARASDAELERLPSQVPARGAAAGRPAGERGARPAGVGRPGAAPRDVPANPGAGSRPAGTGARPVPTPPVPRG